MSTARGPDRIFYVKSRRGKIVRVVREHYLRNDIVCQSRLCKTCKQEQRKLAGPPETTHYAVIDADALVKYLELFEQPEFHHMIIAQTVLTQSQEIGSQRIYQRIRAIVDDGRRNCAVIPNENFADTYVPRDEHQSLADRNKYALVQAAVWYQEHLGDKSPVHIVFVSNDSTALDLATQFGIKAQTVAQFVQNYYGDYPNLFDLYESITQMLQETETEEASEQPKAVSSVTGFEEYKPEDVIDAGIKSGVYFEGVLHVNAYNTDEAWVILDEKVAQKDIFIPSKVLRNRALHLDKVAVEIIDRKLWRSPSSAIRQTGPDEAQDSISGDEGNVGASDQPCGKVVGIIKRTVRPYVCTIQEEDITEKKDTVLAVPWDYRLPKIRIKTRQVAQLANSRILVKIDKWDVDSMYPQGHYVKTLGEIGNLDTEIQVLLQENGITYQPFSAMMLAELPHDSPENPWKVSPEEVKKRRDCRSWRVFSIDPLGSQDIDDALSVNLLPNDIADVTAFVAEGSLLDVEARYRGTSVYLADRRIDMLPTLLSERLISLRANSDRYAVSVIWEFDKDARIVNMWLGRTVINSKYELHYEQAQDILDNKEEVKKQFGAKEFEQLRSDLLHLRNIYRRLRARRLAQGALELASVEVRFDLGSDKRPINIKSKQELEVNALVAEYMILANMSVARFLYQKFPTCALLRRHPLPRMDAFEDVIKLAKVKDFTIDTSSNKALANSLSQAQVEGDPIFNHLLRVMTTYAMAEAQYFSTGSYDITEFYHYGLALEFYTHFTSPIRRYADVVVHRQLLRALEGRPAYMSNEELQKLAEHINTKHKQAKQVQRDSTALFEVLYFKSHENVEEDAVIVSFKTNGFFVYVPRFGLTAPVYVKDTKGDLIIPPNALSLSPETYKSEIVVRDATVTEDKSRMILDTSKGALAINLLEHVTVRIKVGESRAHLPPVKCELVHFGMDPKFRHIAKSLARGEERINIKSEVLKSLAEAKEDKISAEHAEFAQSSGDESIYNIVEKFQQLAISEQQATNDDIPSKVSFNYVPRRTFREEEYRKSLAIAKELERERQQYAYAYGGDEEEAEEEWDESYDDKAEVLPQLNQQQSQSKPFVPFQASKSTNIKARYSEQISRAEREARVRQQQALSAKRKAK